MNLKASQRDGLPQLARHLLKMGCICLPARRDRGATAQGSCGPCTAASRYARDMAQLHQDAARFMQPREFPAQKAPRRFHGSGPFRDSPPPDRPGFGREASAGFRGDKDRERERLFKPERSGLGPPSYHSADD